MKALQVLGPSTGGIRVHVAALASGLTALGVDAAVVGPRGVLDGLGGQDGVVPVPSGLSPVGLARARAAMRPWRGTTDVVHAHGLKAAWVAVGGRPRRPVVLTLHNLVLDTAGPSARARLVLERTVIGRVDRIIAPTSAIADGLRGVVEDRRVRVIVPASPPPVPVHSRRRVRAALGLSDDTPLVLCVARLHPQKDLPTLLRAWRRVVDALPTARLVVIGEGPARRSLEALVGELDIDGSVTLAGFGVSAIDHIAAADVTVLTSVWEAIPLVLAESMQLGVPVVTTDVGLARDLLGDGRGGAVVSVGDDRGVADSLLGYLGDPAAARAAGRAARDVAGTQFDAAVLVRRVLDVYREVA